MTNKDGLVKEGKWKDGKYHGQGIYTERDGRVQEGEFIE